ncbi:MAG: hypothetical protein IPG79_03445 [Saprospiraceae bacterium]|nr:hypothetical protein [Saprospiraceae bacterium]
MISENGLSLENYQMYVALSVGKSGKYIKMQNLNNYTTYKESYELEFYGDIAMGMKKLTLYLVIVPTEDVILIYY